MSQGEGFLYITSMLITEAVEVSILNNNRKYYSNLGYNIDNDRIIINIKDLPKGSRNLVVVRCDICGTDKEISYYNYNKSVSNNGYYSCSGKCSNKKRKSTNLDKYGYEWASQSNDIKDKVKRTNLDKYGVECSLHTDLSRKKTIETNLDRYGTEWASQSDMIKNKIISTNLDKYGVKYVLESDSVKDKIKKKNIEKYGVDNVMKNTEIFNRSKETKLDRYGDENFNNRERAVLTILNKYGVDHYSKTDEYKNILIEYNLNKYGVDHYSKTDEYKEKVKETKLDRYGNPNYNNLSKIQETSFKKYGTKFPSTLESIKDKIKKTNILKYGVPHTLDLDHVKGSRIESLHKSTKEYSIETYSKILPSEYKIIDYHNREFTINHNNDHEFISSVRLIYDRLKYSENCEICTICNPLNSNSSTYENEIVDWLSSEGFEVMQGDRKILGNKQELDIYIPSENIAIEFNGLYWHSELFKHKNYHLNKTKLCEEKGISLLHIFEDDWRDKKNIVKSIIKNRLKRSEIKIWGRKCILKEIGKKECEEFLNENHIQGYSRSKYKIALYYNDSIVSVMTFGYRSINSKKEFELIRFCNKVNHNVVGSASKLFKYFTSKYDQEFDKIISYADISLFNGSLYELLNFKEIHLSKPNYFWVVDGVRYHRFKYNKKKLVNLYGGDPNKSESDIMNERGNYKVWSCGQLRYEFVK